MSVVEAVGDLNDVQIVRIGIAGEWSVREFTELMSQLNFLSNVAALSGSSAYYSRLGGLLTSYRSFKAVSYIGGLFDSIFKPDSRRFKHETDRFHGGLFRLQLDQWLRTSMNGAPTHVARIAFASPGVIDVAGVGKVVEQIRLFIKDIYDRAAQKRDQDIALQISAQELLKRKIANAHSLLKLGKAGGLDQDDVKLLVAQVLNADKFFSEKAASGKFISVEKR